MTALAARAARRLAGPAFVAALTLAATALYGRHGWNGADDGFITGLAWRIVNGQVPYRDFIYIRPPASPYLHALPLLLLPASWAVAAERVLFFGAVASYSLLAITTLGRAFGPVAAPYALALAAFCASASAFPPMPWHTIDGLLLGTCAIALLQRADRLVPLVAAGLLLALMALCKQSFVFLVPLAVVYAGLAHGPRRAAQLSAVLVLLGGAVVAALAARGLLPEALAQMTSETRLSSLVYAGGVAYVENLARAAAPGALIWVAGDRIRRALAGRGWPVRWLPPLVLGTILAAAIVERLIEQRFARPCANYPALLLVGAALGLVYDRRLGRAPAALLGLMLGLAWCASLSWGYATPALFAAPALFGVLLLSARHLGTRPGPFLALLLPLFAALQLVGYRFPYGEAPRSALTEDLGQAFPELRYIRSSPRTLAKLLELRALHERFAGEPFAVLPALPLAGYLTRTLPPAPADWPIESETAGRTAAVLAALAGARAVVLVERASSALCRGSPACCPAALAIQEQWTLIERGTTFDVYRAPDGPAPGSEG